MNWFDEQIRLRKMSDQEIFEESFFTMADAVMGSKMSAALKNENQHNLDEIEEILKFFHIKRKEIPDTITDRNEQLEYLLRPHGFMYRTVKLPKGWYKDAIGPMLAQRKDTGRLEALIPSHLVGFHFTDRETGKKVRINRHTQELFEEEAICFYRPFPLKKLGVKDLLIFMLHAISKMDWIFVIGCMAVITGMNMLVTKLTNLLYSYVLVSKSLQILLAMAVFMASLKISLLMIQVVQTMFSNRTQKKMSLFVNAASMMRVLSLPPSFFKGYSSGELSSRMQYIETLCTSMANLILTTGISTIFSLAYIGQIFEYAPGLVLPALLVTLLTLLVTVITVIMQIRISRNKMQYSAKESGMSYAMISGVQKIKLAGAEKRAFSRWAAQYSRTASLEYNPPLFLKMSSVITQALSLGGTFVLYYFAIKTNVSLADFQAFNSSYAMVSGAFMSLAGIATTIANIKPILDMTKPFLETVPEISEDKKAVDKVNGRIELSHVFFQYQDNMPLILNDLTLNIKAGEYVAIVGETGCGKSTLIRLLLGFETPQKGAVYFDGKDISTIDLRSLRRKIGVVMQNGQLFNGSIFDNIIISAPWLTLSEAWEAAEIAGIADDIRAMPMGMQTIISEGSGGISGGQKQRLMIARAVAPKPKILIFDEATSALDNITQKKVSQALDNLKCTRIVVAHRLSTIRQCDRILFLKDGGIQESGTYDELIEKQGYFAELVERQRLD